MSIQEIIIIVLAAAIIFSTGINYLDKREINSLTAKLAICESSISAQDMAIKAEQANDIKVQKAVNQAEANNATLTQSTIKAEAKIEATPNLTACDQAVSWGANQAMLSAGKWQTTAIPTST